MNNKLRPAYHVTDIFGVCQFNGDYDECKAYLLNHNNASIEIEEGKTTDACTVFYDIGDGSRGFSFNWICEYGCKLGDVSPKTFDMFREHRGGPDNAILLDLLSQATKELGFCFAPGAYERMLNEVTVFKAFSMVNSYKRGDKEYALELAKSVCLGKYSMNMEANHD